MMTESTSYQVTFWSMEEYDQSGSSVDDLEECRDALDINTSTLTISNSPQKRMSRGNKARHNSKEAASNIIPVVPT